MQRITLSQLTQTATQRLLMLGALVTLSASSVIAAPQQAQCPDGWEPSPSPATQCQPGSFTHQTPQPLRFRRADLKVRQYRFSRRSTKRIKIQVANVGLRAARPTVLRLTVRRIDGTPVGRMMKIKVPVINGRQTQWVSLNAAQILPKTVALKDTTFRIDVDSTNFVKESNEKNNTTWHNL
ncbi:CARDB domain-containing protein [Acaryochloris marina]|uniref:CARDB domain-containing protein n=1 Tax=Acaryochloris marina TaxID=155978 RepID=UPI0021C3DBAA|nr:CARDB domain-containing protein [Acaryochloris marina]BDM77468.1 hypothetical protein AM10699_03420 [Acaryochloris marina MBIC10699]